MSAPSPLPIEQTVLFDRVYGSLLASAIGDAMGGPVEGLDYQEIARRWGRVSRYLPYDRPPSYHGAFAQSPGTYTDDTRLRLLLCRAIIDTGDIPSRGEFGRALITAYHSAATDLERGFWEEYALKAFFGHEKLIFAGEPTNGAIMMNSPIGLVCAGSPNEAFVAALDLAFLTDGYAQHSAAAMAAAMAEAMNLGATVDSIVETSLATLAAHRRRLEGPLWQASPKRYLPNERAVEVAATIARRERDVFKVCAHFYDALHRSPLLSEASQTLAVSLGMFVAAGGDLELTLLGCINYGRDCDSYASVAGALAGAFHGAAAVPAQWIPPLASANPAADFAHTARGLCEVVARRLQSRQSEIEIVGALMGANGT